ncbi:hypothetical protein [Microbacterium sp. No. 7]|uniref:hypothetical protein n=1 Tax=Microbacterium sp. No. 7 TaxID=1714373 RepID=UPI0006CFEFEE|nr:hypothetical protein [Microbacterium sp. No. 7]
MPARPTPEWFQHTDSATTEVMHRVTKAVTANEMSQQVQHLPTLAHWFVLDSLSLANQANREGMHANALALTRQCVEAISVIELGICGHPGAEATLLKWEADELPPGKLRAWLHANVWPQYGTGLWSEPWSIFMREFAAAVQPYAHYSSPLAQWQYRLHRLSLPEAPAVDIATGDLRAVIEIAPRAYDAQKETRITLFNTLVVYILGRITMATRPNDADLQQLMARFGDALGKSRYLDGHKTNWSQQFWAMVWERDGSTILE